MEIFYVKEFRTLKKYISVYYGIPVQNQELYLNGIEKIYESPWNESYSELLLKKEKNFIWCENINKIQ